VLMALVSNGRCKRSQKVFLEVFSESFFSDNRVEDWNRSTVSKTVNITSLYDNLDRIDMMNICTKMSCLPLLI
jgi:hypothetical protein